MKVCVKNNNEVAFKNVESGIVFCLNNLYYIKSVDYVTKKVFAINLESGELHEFNSNVLVKIYPDAELNIY